MDSASTPKDTSEPADERSFELVRTRCPSFARGLVIALPLAVALWALIFWLL